MTKSNMTVFSNQRLSLSDRLLRAIGNGLAFASSSEPYRQEISDFEVEARRRLKANRAWNEGYVSERKFSQGIKNGPPASDIHYLRRAVGNEHPECIFGIVHRPLRKKRTTNIKKIRTRMRQELRKAAAETQLKIAS